VVKWNRKARVHCHTGKGNLWSWLSVLDDSVDPECRRCGRYVETGNAWRGSWEEVGNVGRDISMDVPEKWRKKVKDWVEDLAETFFANLDLH